MFVFVTDLYILLSWTSQATHMPILGWWFMGLGLILTLTCWWTTSTTQLLLVCDVCTAVGLLVGLLLVG